MSKRKTEFREEGPQRERMGRSVRLALPFTIKCTACKDSLSKGKKLNARKRRAACTTFYHFKCRRCLSDLSVKAVGEQSKEKEEYAVDKGCKRLDHEVLAAGEEDPLSLLIHKASDLQRNT